MGIRISHADDKTRSALTISNLGQHLADVLPARDWRTLRPLFDGRFAETASIPPREARKIAEALGKAASHQRMPADWADLASTSPTRQHELLGQGSTGSGRSLHP